MIPEAQYEKSSMFDIPDALHVNSDVQELTTESSSKILWGEKIGVMEAACLACFLTPMGDT